MAVASGVVLGWLPLWTLRRPMLERFVCSFAAFSQDGMTLRKLLDIRPPAPGAVANIGFSPEGINAL